MTTTELTPPTARPAPTTNQGDPATGSTTDAAPDSMTGVVAATRDLLAAELTVVIGGSDFRFSAAHTGLHNGQFEPMHGHTYIPTLTLTGVPDHAGMVADFRAVRAALRSAIAPIRSRTLLAGDAGPASPVRDHDSVRFTDGVKTYVLPVDDVVVLPTTNTTTEQIAAYLLAQVAEALSASGVRRAVLDLEESPGTTVTVTTTIPGALPGAFTGAIPGPARDEMPA